ncbi:MAG TPA: hypothetical protein VK463_07780 [Desulfomonilaceae bacterium]|nr:hypothetical protein [Desulfomonilaceae bacterium]
MMGIHAHAPANVLVMSDPDVPHLDFKRIDIIVMILFALFSVLTFLGRWKGVVPFVFLGSDAGIVASFVAAYDNPGLFLHDVLLSDFANFKYYLAIHPVLIHFVKKIVGDYGTAYISLLFFTTFLQAVGFYILGRVLFGNRYWAVLFSIMGLAPIALPVREFWGVYDDPLPRSLFHAMLPYLLAATLKFRRSPAAWPWLMAMAGVSFYAHPVSAPPWAFALWLGMWLFLPDNWNVWKRFGYMFLTGMAFVIVVSPWLVNFLSVHKNAVSQTVSYHDVIDIIGNRVGYELLSVRFALNMWRDRLTSWPLGWYTAWAVGCGIWLGWVFPKQRQELKLIGVWSAAILLVSVGATYVEETICRVYGLRRFQMDAIRGCKYLMPLILALDLWPLALASRQSFVGIVRGSCMILGVLLVTVWVCVHPPVYFLDSVSSLASGSLVPPVTRVETAVREAVAAVARVTPVGSRIFPLALPLEIRYSALRPVAYAYKDGGIFADTNLGALLEWEKVRKELEGITNGKGSGATKLSELVSLSRATHASYLFTDFPVSPTLVQGTGSSVVWSNESFALIKIGQE